MNKFILLTSENFLTHINSFDWEDAFIKEVKVLSPSYVDDDGGIVALDSKFDMNASVCLPEDPKKSIEFIFKKWK